MKINYLLAAFYFTRISSWNSSDFILIWSFRKFKVRKLACLSLTNFANYSNFCFKKIADRSLGVKNYNSDRFSYSTPTLQNEDEVITWHILAEQELFVGLLLDHLFHHILSDQFLQYVFRHILFLETFNS